MRVVLLALFLWLTPAYSSAQSYCQTPVNWCWLPSPFVTGSPCWCFDGFGRQVIGQAFQASPPPRTQERNTESVIQYHFNPVREPEGFLDVGIECRNNMACWGVLEIGAAYFGVSVSEIGTALDVIDAVRDQRGEETSDRLEPPRGRAFCRASVQMTSAAPRDTGRRSTFGFSASAEQIGLYAHTPRQSLGRGRAWIDAVILVSHVPVEDYRRMFSRGECTLPRLHQNAVEYSCSSDSGARLCGSREF